MKKNNKIFITIIFVFILLIVVISAIFIYKNLTYHEVVLTIDDVIDIDNKIKANENVDISYFKDFKVDNKVEENGITIYTYDMGGKYEFDIGVTDNSKIVEMILINKVTYDYVNILEDSLDEFLQFN